MYKNFNSLSKEPLDSIFNRLQKIISQLDILGENISQEDLNMKFLRSLPYEWNTHVVVWRNKADLDTMSLDDLYNNFQTVEQEVKRTVTISSSLESHNMAFLSSLGSTNEVDIANIQVSTVSKPISTFKQIHEDDLEEMDLKWQLALLSMRARRYFQRTVKKININRSDTAGYDKTRVECFNCHKMGYFSRECRSPRNQESRLRNQDNSRKTVNVEDTTSRAMVAIDGADKDETINLVSEQREVQKTAELLKDDDDATLAETLLNIKRGTSKDRGKAQKLHTGELANETARQEQEMYNLEKALELQKQLDQRKEDVDKGDQT
nr:hypothetical protein [Tanacetum cinerariifolium]